MLHNADRTQNKDKFMNFLSIVYFTYDPRSDYSYIVDDDLRLKEVCDSNVFDIPKFSKQELECIELYKKLTTTISAELLRSTKVAVDKVRKFLEDIDLTEVDDKGRLVYPINTVTAAIKQVPQLAKEVREAEKIVAKEIEEQGRARGGNEHKKLFEDGVTLK
jgi:hypothetical protein